MTYSPRQRLKGLLLAAVLAAAVVLVVCMVTPDTHLTPNVADVLWDHGLVHEMVAAWLNLAALVRDTPSLFLLPVLALSLVAGRNPTIKPVGYVDGFSCTAELLSLSIQSTGPPASV